MSYSKIEEIEDHIYYNITIKGETKTTFPLGSLARFEEERVQPLLDNPSKYHLSIVRFQVPGSSIPIFQFPVQDERISTGPITVPGGVGPGRIVLTTADTSNLLGSDLVTITGTANIDGTGIKVIQVLSPTTFSIDIGVVSIASGGNYAKEQNPNQSTLSVTLEHNGDIVRQFLEYVTDTPTGPVPPLVNGSFEKSDYYWVFSYENFIEMINNAFTEAFNNLTSPPVGSLPPYVQYEDEGVLSYVMQRGFYDRSLPNAGRIDIWINIPLGAYLDPFYYQLFGAGLASGKELKLVVRDVPNDYYNPGNVVPVFPPDYYRIPQEYSTLYSWNTFKDLVFVTDSIPVVYEYTQSNSQGLVNFTPILTDFEPAFERAGESRSTLQYYPQGPYRLVDMNSTIPLKRISIQAYWKDEFDVLHPIIIRAGSILSVKLMFRKRQEKNYL